MMMISRRQIIEINQRQGHEQRLAAATSVRHEQKCRAEGEAKNQDRDWQQVGDGVSGGEREFGFEFEFEFEFESGARGGKFESSRAEQQVAASRTRTTPGGFPSKPANQQKLQTDKLESEYELGPRRETRTGRDEFHSKRQEILNLKAQLAAGQHSEKASKTNNNFSSQSSSSRNETKAGSAAAAAAAAEEKMQNSQSKREQLAARSARPNQQQELVRAGKQALQPQVDSSNDSNFVDDFILTEDENLYRNFDPYSVYGEEDEEEDVWYSEERLFEDHIQEIVDKWHSIDDEIWAKIICMERNRRIAKAYARKHTININGSEEDYLDGTTLGLNSFENPDRDSKTSYIKQHIGEGVKIKIHSNGDILVKRLSRSSAFVHYSRPDSARPFGAQLKASQSSSDVYNLNGTEPTEFYGVVPPRLRTRPPAVGDRKWLGQQKLRNELSGKAQVASSTSSGASSGQSPPPQLSKSGGGAQSSNGGIQLQLEKVVRIFSMAKFKQALEFESRRALPNRSRLQNMCISIISFVTNDSKLLNLPSWIMIINIVALDLLASEIGLVEPYDLVGPPTSILAGASRLDDEDAAATTRQPGRSFATGDPASSDFTSEEVAESAGYRSRRLDLPYRKFAPVAFPSGPQIRARNKLPLRSKIDTQRLLEAFPSPVPPVLLDGKRNFRRDKFASSDDLGPLASSLDLRPAGDFRFPPDGKLGPGESSEKCTKSGLASQTVGHQAKEVNSDGELQNGKQVVAPIATGPTNAVELLGSSSSSGFNSQHSSYTQHDELSSGGSSTTSSKNADRDGTASPRQEASAQVKQPSRFRQMIFRRDRANHNNNNNNNNDDDDNDESSKKKKSAAKQESPPGRGKRAPKLPHGIGSKCSPEDTPLMSRPIPIPAPPTSDGGPSGRANLILVSPTGLSPPTSKKQIHTTGTAQGQLDETYETTKRNKLPSGIPSHAQLAPPATRKHILRYLMSASQQNASSAPPLPPPPARRLNRPLPGLPQCQKRSDESLYYSGLQARVPNHNPNFAPHHLPPPPSRTHEAAAAALYQLQAHLGQQQQQHLHPNKSSQITKSAISAILSDMKHSAHFKQQQQLAAVAAANQQQAHRQLAQMAAAAAAAASVPRRQTDSSKRACCDEEDKLSQYLEARRREYQQAGGEQSMPKYMRSLESLNRQAAAAGPTNQKALSSLLNHVGGFLKRSSKAKCAT